MKVLGNDIYIQRGEIWTLDFQVTNERGDPLMLFKNWQHPYLAITVAAARYEQPGDFRETYWLDLDEEYVEQADGSVTLEKKKRFIATEALPLNDFEIEEVLSYYGNRIKLDKTSDFDITNYLFFVDENNDGNRIYKYLSDYVEEGNGDYTEYWEDYDFRIIKSFNTKSWMEQGYLYDIKVLSGQTVKERIAEVLGSSEDANLWDDDETQTKINLIVDVEQKKILQDLFDSGAPLTPDYDTRTLVLQPTNLYVSANIQGGVR